MSSIWRWEFSGYSRSRLVDLSVGEKSGGAGRRCEGLPSHLSLDCKGPDRSKLCFRCRGPDHKSKDCTAAPWCSLCSEQQDKADFRNHIAESEACAVFRDVLEKKKTEMAVVLQCNMHRSLTAHDLLEQICFEKHTDIILISEQYRNTPGPGWYTDNLGTAAIWIRDRQNIHITDHGSGSGFVWVRYQQTYYVSVYLTTSQSISEYQTELEGLEDAARDIQGELVIAGDFNAKAPDWGKPSRTVGVA